MKAVVYGLIAVSFLASHIHAGEPAAPPAWAYVPIAPTQAPADTDPKSVPGTDVRLTRAQIRDLFNVPDWHPNDHPPMPDIVAHGHKPGVYGCAYCHLPNGLGRPENASLAGLPAAYIIQQMADIKSGARRTAQPKLIPQTMMVNLAGHVSDEDVRQAAAYFSSLKPRPWIKVVETGTAPKTRIGGGMLVALTDGGTEPIGKRIIEVPEDLERTELRDSKSGFIAYVPKGSIEKGAKLATHAKPTACVACHGADLRGIGPVPALAGRSPSYLFRQLYDMKSGARAGAWYGLMAPSVAALSQDDMLNIAAYAASLPP
jgi:cytochrome c553